ncbi:MAG: NYN domain-containing protein [Nanoarchaeota archaeon]|nr:NYN domain-containing protein [Nanoarchaeota archaeon]
MDKTFFFIDGGYLSFISKYFGKGKPLKNKIEKFAKNIAKAKNLEIEEIYFYTAPPYQSPTPTEDESRRKAKYDKFILKLKGIKPKINIREGRVQRGENGFQQKGVDTLLTMDLFKISQKQEIKNLIILTSDTDFVPIIQEIRKNFCMKVILAYFTDRKRKSAFSLSNHLWNVCDDKILIKKEYFEY